MNDTSKLKWLEDACGHSNPICILRLNVAGSQKYAVTTISGTKGGGVLGTGMSLADAIADAVAAEGAQP